ncbi:MAG: MotA/TolQ/ExbB proton channel family protein [Opitutales bacterium]|nr:MotA/TolQ/ExbB proton channel family protein [Opitutales bacterium]
MPDATNLSDAQQQAVEKVLSGPQNFGELLHFITSVWNDGGWVMIPLLMLTIYLYFEGASVLLSMNRLGLKKAPQEVWHKWYANPEEGQGHVGEVIRYAMAGGRSTDAILGRIETVRQNILSFVNQKIRLLTVLVAVSPLMGLLGTVIGMLTTFKGLATSTGQTVDLVAKGISVALITTQTGLMIAIPGYLFISLIMRKRNEYAAFLSQLESLSVQDCAKAEKETA